MKINRQKLYKENIKNKRWKCICCDKCFGSRSLRQKHMKEEHHEIYKNKAWNKGLTRETSPSVRAAREKLKQRYANGELVGSWKGKHHSEEVKRKISESRKRYLQEHPDQVPYKLNHYSKRESYAEKYFREWLEKENIQYIAQQQVGLYALDFLVGNIDLEIDGEQHYVDKRVSKSDKRRTEYVESQGFKVIRIRWSHYQKLTQEEKHEYLERLKVALTTDNKLNDNFIIDENKVKRVHGYCKYCNKPLYIRDRKFCANDCRKAFNLTKTVKVQKKSNSSVSTRKQNKDSIIKVQTIYDDEVKLYFEQLVKDLKECNNNHSELARRYKVSPNTIAKRIKRGIKLGFIDEYITNSIGIVSDMKKQSGKKDAQEVLNFYRNILEEYKTSSNSKLAKKYNTTTSTIIYWRQRAEKLLGKK